MSTKEKRQQILTKEKTTTNISKGENYSKCRQKRKRPQVWTNRIRQLMLTDDSTLFAKEKNTVNVDKRKYSKCLQMRKKTANDDKIVQNSICQQNRKIQQISAKRKDS